MAQFGCKLKILDKVSNRYSFIDHNLNVVDGTALLIPQKASGKSVIGKKRLEFGY